MSSEEVTVSEVTALAIDDRVIFDLRQGLRNVMCEREDFLFWVTGG